jgi:AcrR family transcriptional regulator
MADTSRRAPRRTSYHHGDLKRALVEAALQIVGERGIEGLSVAEAARRAGVSPGAPYRHFPSAAHLLAATALRAATELAADLRAADLPDGPEDGAGEGDAGAGLTAAAGVYVRFVARHRAGFDLVFAVGLSDVADDELRTAGREVMDELVPRAMTATGGDARAALDLVEQVVAAAHGYAVLYLTGFLRTRAADVDELVRRVETLVRALVRGSTGALAAPG